MTSSAGIDAGCGSKGDAATAVAAAAAAAGSILVEAAGVVDRMARC